MKLYNVCSGNKTMILYNYKVNKAIFVIETIKRFLAYRLVNIMQILPQNLYNYFSIYNFYV